MATQQQACQLLTLPAELRNAIYTHLLLQQLQVRSPLRTNPQSQQTGEQRICANILSTCKQINQEASPILYGQNLFSAHDSLLTAFPALLTAEYPRPSKLPPVLLPRPLSMIRRYHILVRLDVDPQYDRDQISRSFSSVEELQIQVYQAAYGSCDFSVLALFEAVRGVSRALITGSVGDGLYTTWLTAAMMSSADSSVQPYDMAPGWDFWRDGNR